MILLEILKYTLPSLLVFLTAYFLLKQMFEKQKERFEAELENERFKANAKILTPLSIQAYERLVLFIERISPANLILRQKVQNFSAFQFQTHLIQAVREEFEHNFSQQLYVSNKAWEQVINTKEELVRIINTAASNLKSDDSSAKLGELIIKYEQALDKPLIKSAIETLKKEMQNSFAQK